MERNTHLFHYAIFLNVQLKHKKKLDQPMCPWPILTLSLTDRKSSDESFCIKAESLTQLYFSVTFLARQMFLHAEASVVSNYLYNSTASRQL